MFKRFFITSLVIMLMIFGLVQANAIPNWIQTITNNNWWGIWSPSKNSTTSTPTFTISNDGRVGAGLSDINSLSHSNVKPGYIMAQGYCFENNKECVTTFQQSMSNLKTFNPTPDSRIAKNKDGSTYTPEIGKPFFINIDKNFLNIVGMDPEYGTGEFVGQQATNWFKLGEVHNILNTDKPKSLWIEEGDNFHPAHTAIYENGPFIADSHKKLLYCNHINEHQIKSEAWSIHTCSKNDGSVINNVWCDLRTKTCGTPYLEVRMTMANETTKEKCHTYRYSPILYTLSWSTPTFFNTKATAYESIENYNIPERCFLYQFYHAQIQARIVFRGADAQSLVKLSERVTLQFGMGRFGINILQ